MTQHNQQSQCYSDILSDVDYYIANASLNDLDRKEVALAAYEEAIQLSPYEASFYQRKGQVLEQLGRLTEAQRAYEEAYRLGYRS